ncbi:MAG: hypothetical protein U1A78_01290 [Polyangia bacterium]
MAKSTNITDVTGRSSLIGPKTEDPVRPPKPDTLIGPKPEDPHAAGDPRGVGARVPTPGGPKPR